MKKEGFQKTNDPIFAFANFKTAHSPYKNAPEPYKSYFTDDSIRPTNPLLDIAYREFLDRTPEKIDGLEYGRLSQLANDFPLLTNQSEPTDQEWQVILDWYDGAIRYMDQKVGLILDELSKANELNNTWIIVTADHGELFGEHGLESHIFSLYDTLLRVPLIIRPPGGGHNTVSEMCSWIDLYPTICEIAGADYPDRNHAKSLLPVGSNPDHDHIYAEVSRKYPPKVKHNHPDFELIKQNGPLQSVRNELWKLIQFHSGDVELHNWADDPSEMTDCSDSHPTVVKRLQNQLDTELGDMDLSSHHETTVTSADVRDRLEHLGYL